MLSNEYSSSKAKASSDQKAVSTTHGTMISLMKLSHRPITSSSRSKKNCYPTNNFFNRIKLNMSYQELKSSTKIQFLNIWPIFIKYKHQTVPEDRFKLALKNCRNCWEIMIAWRTAPWSINNFSTSMERNSEFKLEITSKKDKEFFKLTRAKMLTLNHSAFKSIIQPELN